MRKVGSRAALLDPETQAVIAEDRRDHLRRQILRQHASGFSFESALEPEREPREIRRRRPESRGRHFGIRVPLARDRPALPVVAGSGGPEPFGRQRLIVSALGHAERAENRLGQDLRVGLSLDIDQGLLNDRVAASGVAILRSRRDIHADRRRVGGGDAVEDLRQLRDRAARGVAGKPVNRDPGAVGEQHRECHGLLASPVVFRELPGLEVIVDVPVERDLAPGNLGERRHRRDGLADRSRLEERRVCGRGQRVGVGHAVGLRPEDLAGAEDRDRDGGHLVEPHPLLDRPRLLPLEKDRRPQSALDLLDLRRRRRRPRAQSSHRYQQDEGRKTEDGRRKTVGHEGRYAQALRRFRVSVPPVASRRARSGRCPARNSRRGRR